MNFDWLRWDARNFIANQRKTVPEPDGMKGDHSELRDTGEITEVSCLK